MADVMLDEKIKRLAQGRNYGTVSTVLRDGSPVTHVMWVDADDVHVILNTEVHRTKFKNVQRDPRASVVVWDADDPYVYGEVRGRVVDIVTGPKARQHIDELSMKYRGRPYDPNAIKSERVILKIAPERQRPPKQRSHVRIARASPKRSTLDKRSYLPRSG